MDDTANPHTKSFLLFGAPQTCRHPLKTFSLTTSKCHPLHHCHLWIASSLLFLHLECCNSSAECHYFECDIKPVNILTSCLYYKYSGWSNWWWHDWQVKREVLIVDLRSIVLNHLLASIKGLWLYIAKEMSIGI